MPDAAPVTDEGGASRRSLLDDVEDLLVDARIWFDAEVAYQKTRAGFVAAQIRNAVALLLAAAVLTLVALIALAVGLVITLIPVLGPFGATLVVFVVLVLVAILLARSAASRWRDAAGAIRESEE